MAVHTAGVFVPTRRGYTLIELLFVMAMIAVVMSTFGRGVVAGAEAYRRPKGIGHLNESLRQAAHDLREDLVDTNRSTEEFLIDRSRYGSADPEAVAAVLGDDDAICTAAVDLEARLRELERETVNLAARRILRRAIDDLRVVKEGAVRMVEIREVIESTG